MVQTLVQDGRSIRIKNSTQLGRTREEEEGTDRPIHTYMYVKICTIV
jgi:hypothetical protein